MSTRKEPILVAFEQDEIEEVAALVTMYCDLDPDTKPALVVAKKKLLVALVEAEEEPLAVSH